jgi:hypothetical protein
LLISQKILTKEKTENLCIFLKSIYPLISSELNNQLEKYNQNKKKEPNFLTSTFLKNEEEMCINFIKMEPKQIFIFVG